MPASSFKSATRFSVKRMKLRMILKSTVESPLSSRRGTVKIAFDPTMNVNTTYSFPISYSRKSQLVREDTLRATPSHMRTTHNTLTSKISSGHAFTDLVAHYHIIRSKCQKVHCLALQSMLRYKASMLLNCQLTYITSSAF